MKAKTNERIFEHTYIHLAQATTTPQTILARNLSMRPVHLLPYHSPERKFPPSTLPLHLPHPLHTPQPPHPVLRPLLRPRLQPVLMQPKIIHRPNPQDAPSRKRRSHTIHERTAGVAEIVGHGVPRGDGVRLAESLEAVPPAQVAEVGVGDGEVGREQGR